MAPSLASSAVRPVTAEPSPLSTTQLPAVKAKAAAVPYQLLTVAVNLLAPAQRAA